jgi:hypothetical protein
LKEKLKDELLKAFTGKMENKQAFVMQFVMNYVQKGNPPPDKKEIDSAISELIESRVFREKGDLLILQKKPETTDLQEEEEPSLITTPIENSSQYSELELILLENFQGKFENKTALFMNVTMNEVQKGKTPPSKEDLNKTLQDLISRDVLQEKGDTLVKKV